MSGACIILATGALSACATTDYVDQKVAEVQSQVTTQGGQISALEQRVAGVESHVSSVANDVQAATALAAGKFNYTKVGEATVLFDTGSYHLADAEQAKLVELANQLKSANKNVYLEIEGHADARGGKSDNRRLGMQRAYAVYDLLRDQGIALNRISIITHGEDHPADASQLDLNRRVVITLVQ